MKQLFRKVFHSVKVDINRSQSQWKEKQSIFKNESDFIQF